jgi:1-acyl-sn-glycerol-3-phosphate acyltransferase
MAYKKGAPLINDSIVFRFCATVTFFFCWTIAHIINLFLYRTKFFGKEKLSHKDKNFRAILISNHTAIFDPVEMSALVTPGRIWQTLLEATVLSPVVGTLTRLLGGIPLAPGMAGVERIVNENERLFKYRRYIHFYPEGDCYFFNQEIKPLKIGAFYVAAVLNIPIYPVVTVWLEKHNIFGRIVKREQVFVLDPVMPRDFIVIADDGKPRKESLRAFAEMLRGKMQSEIDARGGSRRFYKGRMERIKGIN